MALKRRQRISPGFSMSSMTDLIFLLLIFFMITSTMVSPNAIKVLLPQGSQQTSAKPMARIIYVALYADESVPYREIVRILNVANENHFKMVLATRRPDKK